MSLSAIRISRHLDRSLLMEHLMPIILLLSHDPSDGRKKIAIKMMNFMAQDFGRDNCIIYLVPEYKCLAEEPSPRVRKKLASNFRFICSCLGEEETCDQIVRLKLDFFHFQSFFIFNCFLHVLKVFHVFFNFNVLSFWHF